MGLDYTPSNLTLLVEVLLLATMAAGVALNLLVLRLRRRRLTWVWAACNLLTVAKTPLLVATMHKGHWPAGGLLCRAYMAAATLQQWAAPWLMVFCCLRLLIPKDGRLRSVIGGLCGLVVCLPVFLVFCTTAHLETEEISKCFVPVAPNDFLWTSLVTFLFSFHTPSTMAACFLLVAAIQRPNDRAGLKKFVAILVSQVLFFLLFWITQLHLLELKPSTNIKIFLIAGLLMDLHAAVAVPSLIYWCGGLCVEEKKEEKGCFRQEESQSLDGFLESLKTELKVELPETE